MSKVYCDDCEHYGLECHHPDNWVWVDFHDCQRITRKWWASFKNKNNDCDFYERKIKKRFFWWRNKEKK